MLSLPKFLCNLSDQAARKTQAGDPVKIELLRFERAKEGGWKSYLGLGDVLLTVNVPSDPIGHGDAVFLCEALATALRGDPPDQMALPGFSRADPKFVGPKQPSLPSLPEPGAPRAEPPPVVPPPAGAGPHDDRAGAGAVHLSPPHGRKPKPGPCRFLVVGSSPRSEILIAADGLIRKWDHTGDPNDTYTADEVLGPWSPGETKTVAECTRVTYAGHLNVSNHALWLADAQYYPGRGQWVHIQALGRGEMVPTEPLAPRVDLPSPSALPHCCVCDHPMRPNAPGSPRPRKCVECWEAGKGPKVNDTEVAERADTLPPEGERESDHHQTSSAVDSTEPFEPCRSCKFFEELSDAVAECLHKNHPHRYFMRPCLDRVAR